MATERLQPVTDNTAARHEAEVRKAARIVIERREKVLRELAKS